MTPPSWRRAGRSSPFIRMSSRRRGSPSPNARAQCWASRRSGGSVRTPISQNYSWSRRRCVAASASCVRLGHRCCAEHGRIAPCHRGRSGCSAVLPPPRRARCGPGAIWLDCGAECSEGEGGEGGGRGGGGGSGEGGGAGGEGGGWRWGGGGLGEGEGEKEGGGGGGRGGGEGRMGGKGGVGEVVSVGGEFGDGGVGLGRGGEGEGLGGVRARACRRRA